MWAVAPQGPTIEELEPSRGPLGPIIWLLGGLGLVMGPYSASPVVSVPWAPGVCMTCSLSNCLVS